jgi:class 3 adenylate cyclase
MSGEEGKDEDEDEEEITLSGHAHCCVSFVDMVDSSNLAESISDAEKIGRLYSIFLNTMAVVARNYGARIIKNAGDSLIYYFPQTVNVENKNAFRDVIECCITEIAARCTINTKLYEEKLPSLNYRISADYGRVEIAKAGKYKNYDLFGPTMNRCAKINAKAAPNSVVIGDNMYKLVKPFEKDYEFKEVGEYELASTRQLYPLYSVLSKEKIANRNDTKFNKQIPTLQYTPMRSEKPRFVNAHVIPSQKQQKSSIANIMIVEDEPDILSLFKFSLVSNGFNVDAFTDSQKALKQFGQVDLSYYGLAILDIRMPGLNGLQLYYRLKAIDKGIKILFVTALDAVDEIASILPGMNHDNIIRKPITIKDFIQKVESALLH